MEWVEVGIDGDEDEDGIGWGWDGMRPGWGDGSFVAGSSTSDPNLRARMYRSNIEGTCSVTTGRVGGAPQLSIPPHPASSPSPSIAKPVLFHLLSIQNAACGITMMHL